MGCKYSFKKILACKQTQTVWRPSKVKAGPRYQSLTRLLGVLKKLENSWGGLAGGERSLHWWGITMQQEETIKQMKCVLL